MAKTHINSNHMTDDSNCSRKLSELVIKEETEEELEEQEEEGKDDKEEELEEESNDMIKESET